MSEEDEMQAALLDWAGTMLKIGKYPELETLFHVPNEGKRTASYGHKLKEMGMKRGVPDLVLPVARGGYGGLYIELKKPDGKVSEFQRQFIRNLRKWGQCAGVCRSWTDASQVIEKYLKGEIVNVVGI